MNITEILSKKAIFCPRGKKNNTFFKSRGNLKDTFKKPAGSLKELTCIFALKTDVVMVSDGGGLVVEEIFTMQVK